jgi:hypothetical protein
LLFSTLRLTPSLVGTLRAFGSRFRLVVSEWGGKPGIGLPSAVVLVCARVRPQLDLADSEALQDVACYFSCAAARSAPGGNAFLASERESIALLRLRRSLKRLMKEAWGRASLVRWVRVIMSFAQAL